MASGSSPQFDTAHFGGKDTCALCGLAIGSSYYRLQGQLICSACGLSRKTELESAPDRFRGAVLWGLGAALLGLALYSIVGIVTGYEIGFVSLAVGFIIGKGVLKGSGGVGGRRYQILAVILTYFAVSMSAIPIGVGMLMKGSPEVAAEQSDVEEEAVAETGEDAAGEAAAEEGAATETAAEEKGGGVGLLLLTLLGLGLASPFLGLAEMPGGIIGLIILLVGMQIAWRITGEAPGAVEGPFEDSPAASNG